MEELQEKLRITPEDNEDPNKKQPVTKRQSTEKHKQKTFFKRRTPNVAVIYEGVDRTPLPLTLHTFTEEKGEARSSMQAPVDSSLTESGTTESAEETVIRTHYERSFTKFHTDLGFRTEGSTMFQQSHAGTVDDFVVKKQMDHSQTSIASDFKSELDLQETKPPEMPKNVSLILAETSTFFILDMPSKTAEKDTEEGNMVEEDNTYYEYITEGKGRNRKVVNAEVQTVEILTKSRSTEAKRTKNTQNFASSSNWELYDTYNTIEPIELVKNVAEELHEELSRFHLGDEEVLPELTLEEDQMLQLVKSDRFLEALCVTERILANNNYNAEQKLFRGLIELDPFREDVEYNYTLKLLWTFANNQTEDRCVAAICWNHKNRDVLAVGYGKFYFTDITPGMVMIWNIKNPVQPERVYNFDDPVSSLDFSKVHPNLLAVGFYNGHILVLDVSSRDLRTIAQSSSDSSPSFEAVWQVLCCQGDDYYKNEEQIITTCQDGRISRYRLTGGLVMIYNQIMRIPRPEGKLKGIETLRRCHVPGIQISRYAPALCMMQHPVDSNLYFTGTSEGSVHKCSKNYHHQHLDVFLAHDGPMYDIKTSPFCDKLFLTCGADWAVRIWAHGVTDPLIKLSYTMDSVQGADWSKTNSTIIGNICGDKILIWDLQRKTYEPQSITTSPTNGRNTVIQFTENGRCVVVGDIKGNVHVFALEDMPIPPFFQENLLSNAIQRLLITNPDLLRQFMKLGSLNFDKNVEKYFE